MIIKDNSEIRAEARNQLSGNWTNPVLFTLLYILVAAAITAVSNSFGNTASRSFIELLLNIFILLPIAYAFVLYFLRFNRNDREAGLGKYLFYGFDNYKRTLGITLLATLYRLLWTLLFVIPGIIKAYSYAMTYFISYDNPELSAEECINRSMKMMEGHKFDLFLLDLSFIGWFLLSIVTCGIGFLWLFPYVNTSRVVFYEELKLMELEGVQVSEIE